VVSSAAHRAPVGRCATPGAARPPTDICILRGHDREARADGQRGELIARIAAGARQSASMGAAGVFDTYLATSGWDFCTGVGSPRGYFSK